MGNIFTKKVSISDNQPRKKVFVGMSGGVDSSVSAELLKEAGFDVTGVFIKVWYPDFFTCNWKEERRDAMRVSARLGIPFVTLDLEDQYKKDVVDYMIREYKAGRTPNPDVMCNRFVKFGGFLKYALMHGADYVATGHYAERRDIGGRSTLFESKDKEKDQSYFLWTLTHEDLSRILFPVGGMKKSEVRKQAKRLGLPVADKRDSQGLCFIGKIGMKEFLSHYVSSEKGDVLDTKGGVIGNHDGAIFYTIGERHGFNINHATSNDSPYYVVSKDVENNTITVSKKDVSTNVGVEFALSNSNWLTKPFEGQILEARFRYRQRKQKIKYTNKGGTDYLYVDKPEELPAVGQSCVVYNDEEVMGGGIIEPVTPTKNNE